MSQPDGFRDEFHDAVALKVTGSSGKAVLFLKLVKLYPECLMLTSDAPQLHPLFCLAHDVCPRNQSCMDKLVMRTKYIFDTFPDVVVLLLYFKHHDKPDSHRAGVFRRDMTEPRLITFNRSVWEKMKTVGTAYAWTIPDSVFLQSNPLANQLVTLRAS